MSNGAQTQHPAVVLRPSYQHLRALLAIAAIAIVGLTVAVVVLATRDGHEVTSSAASVVPPAISTSATSELGAKLDHRGLKERFNATSGGSVPAPRPDFPGHH
jgi:hypothetical protein